MTPHVYRSASFKADCGGGQREAGFATNRLVMGGWHVSACIALHCHASRRRQEMKLERLSRPCFVRLLLETSRWWLADRYSANRTFSGIRGGEKEGRRGSLHIQTLLRWHGSCCSCRRCMLQIKSSRRSRIKVCCVIVVASGITMHAYNPVAQNGALFLPSHVRLLANNCLDEPVLLSKKVARCG